MFIKIKQTFDTPYGEYPIYVEATDLGIVEKPYDRKCELIGWTPEPGELAHKLELIDCTLLENGVDLFIGTIQLAFGHMKGREE